VIVYSADLHLSPTIWRDMSMLAGDAYRAFNQLIDVCIDEQASALVLGGDIFDKPRPDSQSVAVFIEGVSRLVDTDVYVVQGQHERAEPPWACLDEGVHYIGDGQLVTLEDEGVTFTLRGYDNAPVEVMKQAMKDMDPAPDILVIHQLEKKLVPFEGSWDFDMKWVPKETKLILGGDYHIHANEKRLWYPGSTHMRNIDERGAHYLLLVTPGVKNVAKGRGKKKVMTRQWDGKFEVQAQRILNRPIIDCVINDASHVDAGLAVITGYAPDPAEVDDELEPLVYLKYNPQVEDALERVTEVCKEKGYFLRTKATISGPEVVEGVPQLGTVTLQECLSQVVDRDKEPEFFSFALALLTDDHKIALNAAKAQFGLVKESN
jgi:hypothetical protein